MYSRKRKFDAIVPSKAPPKLNREAFEKSLIVFWKKFGLIKPENKQFFDTKINPTLQKVIEQEWQDYQKLLNYYERNAIVNSTDPRFSSTKECYKHAFSSNALISDSRGLLTTPILDLGSSLSKISFDASNKMQIDFPNFIENEWHSVNTIIMSRISCTTELKQIFMLMDAGADINKYSIVFGNNPLLLAVSKGWNHLNLEFHKFESSRPPDDQRQIILTLLNKKEIEINARHLFNGMTALHLACLRGDDPEFIKLLIAKGADTTAKDYFGRSPLDLLDIDFDKAKEIIYKLTDAEPTTARLQEMTRKDFDLQDNEWITYTVPKQDLYYANKIAIREILNPSLETKSHYDLRPRR